MYSKAAIGPDYVVRTRQEKMQTKVVGYEKKERKTVECRHIKY